MSDNHEVTLTIGFDIDQISDKLTYKFKGRNGDTPNHPTGLYDNEILLVEGDQLSIEVIGTGAIGRGLGLDFSSYQIVDCCFVTLPRVIFALDSKDVRRAPPSPFVQALGASYPLYLDFSSSTVDTKTLRTVTQGWKKTLDVTSIPGRWAVSLYLTVRIYRGPNFAPEIRVFSFDPECQVGAGRDDTGNGTPGGWRVS
ncbi:hypothetical protein GCM10027277_43700 [Pseudoduganella ginsengisoli]|uniref:Uncharacterized protein n=1 Tax=Pseudoduganella ginsengisoli TaxID=1462440 RepID=A0A6L6QAV8_9BURK|nr:hypothetical protein [Pseudoduganella ginsengisoli]MTW06352.1 hypothetical protein [Pseudoduganella ginsengisoli]